MGAIHAEGLCYEQLGDFPIVLGMDQFVHGLHVDPWVSMNIGVIKSYLGF